MSHSTTRRNTKFLLTILTMVFCGQAVAAGALAINTNKGSQFGWGIDHSTTDRAEQTALRQCGSGCEVVLTFNSGCAAYAADQGGGSNAYGWGSGSSAGAVQAHAITECQSRGGKRCVIRVWGCNGG